MACSIYHRESANLSDPPPGKATRLYPTDLQPQQLPKFKNINVSKILTQKALILKSIKSIFTKITKFSKKSAYLKLYVQ